MARVVILLAATRAEIIVARRLRAEPEPWRLPRLVFNLKQEPLTAGELAQNVSTYLGVHAPAGRYGFVKKLSLPMREHGQTHGWLYQVTLTESEMNDLYTSWGTTEYAMLNRVYLRAGLPQREVFMIESLVASD